MQIGIRHIAVPLVGLVATVLVAWLMLANSQSAGIATPAFRWPAHTPADWPKPKMGKVVVDRGVLIETVSWADPGMEFLPQTTRWKDLEASAVRCGWPWPAVTCVQWSVTPWSTGTKASFPSTPRLWVAGLLVRWPKVATGCSGEHRLPVQPLWPGFAVDAILFTAVAAALAAVPAGLRWGYRRRCGLCVSCAYPIAQEPRCTECGLRAKPWPAGGGPVRAYSPRLVRRVTFVCVTSVVVTVLLYLASGWATFYVKAPRGMYAAVWHGQCAFGRSATPFPTLGIEAAPHDGGFLLLFQVPGRLVGSWVCLPLWLPVPALILIGAAAWWHAAIRRGLARHWPAPSQSTGPSDTSASASPP
jgi:hypothetical protein